MHPHTQGRQTHTICRVLVSNHMFVCLSRLGRSSNTLCTPAPTTSPTISDSVFIQIKLFLDGDDASTIDSSAERYVHRSLADSLDSLNYSYFYSFTSSATSASTRRRLLASESTISRLTSTLGVFG